MFRFNIIGLVMFLLAGVLYGVLSSFVTDQTATISAMISLVFLDLGYRFWNGGQGWERWLTKEHGGMLIIMPAWFFGLVSFVIWQFV